MSKDILKNALLMFDGTLIVVSHDRDFLQGLTQKVFEFKDGKVKQHIGDVYDFLEKRKIETLDQLSAQNARSQAKQSSDQTSNNKQQYEKKKLFEKELRKVTGRIEKTEEEINKVESELAEMDRMLADPDKYKEFMNNSSLYDKYNGLKKKLEELMSSWEQLHDEAETMKRNST
jgi:ATP-binding cassette, subfamily F, member 3